MPDRLQDLYSNKPRGANLAELYRNQKLNALLEEIQQDYKTGDRFRADRQGDVYDDPEAKASRTFKPLSLADDDELPYVPKPSMFQPDPFVVGSPREATVGKRLLDLDPGTKQRIKNITFGPTTESMDRMLESRLPIDRFGRTSLLGVTSNSGQIGINPELRDDPDYDAGDVMSHEIAHRAGYNEIKSRMIAEKVKNIFSNFLSGYQNRTSK